MKTLLLSLLLNGLLIYVCIRQHKDLNEYRNNGKWLKNKVSEITKESKKILNQTIDKGQEIISD